MGKLKVFVVAILVIAVIGGGTMFYLKKDLIFGPKVEKAITAEELAELSIDTDVITTNLASASNFAIVQFNILLSSEEAKEETEKRTPEVRAAIISTIANLSKEQLVGGDGITTLEKELSTKLSKIVETGKVERVLVTEFKVQ